jgi:hypothetical protein
MAAVKFATAAFTAAQSATDTGVFAAIRAASNLSTSAWICAADRDGTVFDTDAPLAGVPDAASWASATDFKAAAMIELVAGCGGEVAEAAMWLTAIARAMVSVVTAFAMG